MGLSPLDLAGAVLSWEALKDSLWWAASLTLTVQLADSTTVHGEREAPASRSYLVCSQLTMITCRAVQSL